MAITRIIITLFLLLLFSCKSIDYNLVNYPPYESNMRIDKVMHLAVLGPLVINKNNAIDWYASNYFDVYDGRYIAYFSSILNDETADFYIHIQDIEANKEILMKKISGDVAGINFLNKDSVLFSCAYSGHKQVHLLNIPDQTIEYNIFRSNSNQLNPQVVNDSVFVSSALGYCAPFYNSKTGINQKLPDKLGETEFTINVATIGKTEMKSFGQGFSPSKIPGTIEIVFCKNNNKTGLGEIWKMNLKNGISNPVLKFKSMGFSNPAVSPDGKKIVCVGSTEKRGRMPMNLNLFMINIDGTGYKQITCHPSHDVSPVWSDDMKYIYFLSERVDGENNFNIWKLEYQK